MRVKGSAGVWVLLGNRGRNIHSVRLLTILGGRRRDQAGPSMGGWCDHPCTAVHHRTENMLGLGLVVWHLLHKGLACELLGATGEVLGGVGRVWGHYVGACSRVRVHHGRCPWLMVLVRSLLGHVGYFTWSVGLGLAHSHMRNWNMVHCRRLNSWTDWSKWVHLWEAHMLAIHSRLLHNDGRAGLTLWPWQGGCGSWFGWRAKRPGVELLGIWIES